ncbi:hypothetical protein SAMN04488694_11465 [Natrinema hispanicum]|uniref:Transposase DDE domain-containing protein n=1 Tax=Natrinema hispanicum TaxID=392421 RepID=A0A1I0HQF6_9EURY|nr:hypothetical protein SAMN04488694_11465 [Natrinema hispanicum]
MYLGIDIHKRYSQVAVMNDAGEIVEEVRVENANLDDRYAQRSMTETVNSAVKRSLGYAVRARTWYREFREIALMCVVYNIKQAIKQ